MVTVAVADLPGATEVSRGQSGAHPECGHCRVLGQSDAFDGEIEGDI